MVKGLLEALPSSVPSMYNFNVPVPVNVPDTELAPSISDDVYVTEGAAGFAETLTLLETALTFSPGAVAFAVNTSPGEAVTDFDQVPLYDVVVPSDVEPFLNISITVPSASVMVPDKETALPPLTAQKVPAEITGVDVVGVTCVIKTLDVLGEMHRPGLMACTVIYCPPYDDRSIGLADQLVVEETKLAMLTPLA